MPSLQTGTVTFLFTDIEASTRLLQQLGNRYADVLAGYQCLVRAAVRDGTGNEVNTEGDAFLATLPRAREALTAAISTQRSILRHRWPEDVSVRVRIALHTGEALVSDAGYVGMDVHRAARICAAGHGGQILLSEATHALVAQDLPDGVSMRDLGQHRLKDLARPQRLFQVVVADLPADFAPLNSLNVLPNNLPVQLTSFIGRGRETAEIKTKLAQVRLLTLTGPGGSGKTRLALHVGADLLEQYHDGVWLVDFSGLADSALVPQTVASALGVPEKPGWAPTATLIDFLRRKSLLLIVDNCEHLLAACAGLADALLRACANLTVLATSREDLGIAGEVLYAVPPFPVPDPEQTPSLEQLLQYEAVRLFAERATAVLPSFRVILQNAESVARICHRLDGIPLAIELAAARMKVLTAQQIVGRLNDRFRLLTGGSRVALRRQQTLRATMDWSYELLSEEERRTLRQLCVFAGGCTLEGAEGVCGGSGETGDVLDLLTHLVQRSLVTPEGKTHEVRYRMLETVRQYAWEKLRDSGEATTIRDRHSQWYLALAERAEPELRGPEQAAWLARLDSDHDNFRAALDWLVDRGETETALRLTNALWRFWFTRGYLREGRGRLEETLHKNAGADTPLRVKALIAAGYLALNQEDYQAASGFLEEGLSLGRRLGNRQETAVALNWLGVVAWRLGEFDRAEALYEQGLALCEGADAEERRTRLLNSLALLNASRGDFTRARRLLEDCLAAYRRTRDKTGIALVAGNLAVMVFRQGDYAAARSLVMESVELFREVGEVRGMASDLQLLGILAAMAGQPERAARILGAVEAVRATVGAPFARTERLLYDYERYLTAIQGSLSEEVFRKTWAEGRAMRVDQAVEYAQRESPDPWASPERAGQVGPQKM